MKDIICDEFQSRVSEVLLRHQSILDILSKLQETNARINRKVTKSVTSCGCIQIEAKKKPIPPDATIFDLLKIFDSHLQGNLCPDCQETIESEIGKSLFYLTALCNTLDLNLYDIFLKENAKISTLRHFNFT